MMDKVADTCAHIVSDLLSQLPPPTANIPRDASASAFESHVAKLEDAYERLTLLRHLDPDFKKVLNAIRGFRNGHGSHGGRNSSPATDDGPGEPFHDFDHPPVVDGRTNAAGQWQNWGRSVEFKDLKQPAAPRTTQEVQTLVRAAKAAGRTVRCVGHGHTWTPVFHDGGSTQVIFAKNLLVHGTNETIVLERGADITNRRGARVRVAAGVTTRDLATWMEANAADIGHVGLPSDVILDNVQYAGVISMACHGTGKNGRPLADYVMAMTVVDGNGDVRVVGRDVDGGAADFTKFMTAAFGLTGVIIDLTLQLDNNFDRPYVRVEHTFPPMGLMFGQGTTPDVLKQFVQSNEGVELFWMPFGSLEVKTLLESKGTDFLDGWDPYKDPMWRNTFVERVAADPATVVHYGYDQDGWHRLARERLEGKAGAAINALSNKMELRVSEPEADGGDGEGAEEQGGSKGGCFSVFHDRAPALRTQVVYGNFAFKMLKLEAAWPFGYLRSGVLSQPKAIHYKSYIDDFPCYDYEVCIPVADDFRNVYDAWRAVVRLAEAEIRTNHYNPLNVALEVRFTRGTADAVLSPAYSPGNPDQLFAWIEVLGSATTPINTWLDFMKRVHDAWVAIPHPGGAKPKLHWAKWNDISEAIAMGASARDDWITPYVKQVYGNHIAEFRTFLDRYHGRPGAAGNLFVNSWAKKIFY